jgi:DNA-binding beta-propeller fold protein YncE
LISKYAGTGTAGYNGDGVPAYQAHLNGPHGLAVDDEDNLLIADTGNQRIRRVSALTGEISTVVGSGFTGNSGDGGPALLCSMNGPYAVAVDGNDHIFIADSGNHRIRVTDDEGEIEEFAGNGTAGRSGDGGEADDAQFNRPQGIAVASDGNLWIADTNNHVVRQLYSCVLTPTPVPDVDSISAEVYHNRFFPAKGESMAIRYQLTDAAKVLIRIFDSRGREVGKLLNADQARGHYQMDWDGKDASGGLVASGLYVIRFEIGSWVQMKKLVVIR